MKSYCFQKLGLDSYAVEAYSGVAAKNVNGITIHSFLKIPPKPQYFRDLNGSPIARIAAENNSKKAFSCTDDMANGLSNVLYLALNSRIMLRKNLNVSMGLVNGALGTITDIIYAKGCRPPQLPLFVIVQFDDHDGFEALDGNVPIRASQADWYVSRSHCTRAQFPLS
ncbi:ATP-dependent DNA helicase [Frankliniella fusca]|uniref:ATP-dependent DNA helicase n=1 Tax=Frankliniella fusca TaxID=407009 RepID=A0AAE1H3G2_9NEOP|nr:ATP-dependent DNA helicase [Frankliniella fusca]